MLRPKKKHDSHADDAVTPPDPLALIAAQSAGKAIVAGMLATLMLCILWTAITVATGRIFPWFSIVLGAIVGRVVRRYGQGLDYRFPLIAAILVCTGALLGNLMIAIPSTTEELDASAWQVVRGLTWRSFEIFFDEVITAVEYIYAGFAAALAVFYSRRRLQREEEFALRTMQGSDVR
ncbi:MAG: hypothetical protein WDZ50_06360 [Woeseia sp.]